MSTQTKMHRSIIIRRQINADMEKKYPITPTMTVEEQNIVLATRLSEGSSIFRNRAKKELEMTAQGASTYCRNVLIFLRGEDPYASNKKNNEKRRDMLLAAKATPGLEAIATKLGELLYKTGMDTTQRWWVINDQNHVVSTHSKRDIARQAAATFKNRCVDRNVILAA